MGVVIRHLGAVLSGVEPGPSKHACPGPWHLNPRASGDSHLQFRLSRATLFLELACYCSMHVSMGVCMYACVCRGENYFIYHLPRFSGWCPVKWADKRQINKGKTNSSYTWECSEMINSELVKTGILAKE